MRDSLRQAPSPPPSLLDPRKVGPEPPRSKYKIVFTESKKLISKIFKCFLSIDRSRLLAPGIDTDFVKNTKG